MKKVLFLLIISIFLTSCLDKTETGDNICDPECNSWEICSDSSVCELADGKCNLDTDCEDGYICNSDTHSCEERSNDCDPACEEWESCNSGTCELTEGRCINNSDCNSGDSCNLNTHICEEESNDCTPACKQWESCNNGTCELLDGRCNNDTDCETSETCNQTSHNCIADNRELTISEVKGLTVSKNVTTSGKITHIVRYEDKVGGFYMQDGVEHFNGIYVFIKDGATSPLKLGDTVKVTGKAWEYFGIIRIGDNENTPSFQITDNTTDTPEPKILNSSDMELGDVDMLLKINNTPFTVVEMGDAPNYHTIIEDSNGDQFIINSKLYRFNENGVVIGSVIEQLTGIGGAYEDEDDGSFLFLLRPRGVDDIIFSNSGTEGYSCRDEEPFCNSGLKCNELNICEIRLPCDDSCTDLQYCDEELDQCIDLVLESVSEVRALTEEKIVMIEAILTHYDRKNSTTANYYLQDGTDPYSGIQIYYKNDNPPAFTIGDKIRIIGLAHDYQGFIEIGDSDAQPRMELVESDQMVDPKQIVGTDINEENLYLFVEMLNPPFTVVEVETAHPKYVTFEDSEGNRFLLNNDFVDDWIYFEVGDVLSTLKGVVSYRYSSGITYTINPRSEDDFEFVIE